MIETFRHRGLRRLFERGDPSGLRPDMVVRLPGDKRIVVDAKAPVAAYLAAWPCRGPDALLHAAQRL